jgi:hypothetical protein
VPPRPYSAWSSQHGRARKFSTWLAYFVHLVHTVPAGEVYIPSLWSRSPHEVVPE